MTPDTLLIASTAGATWAGDVEFGSDSTVPRPIDALALGSTAGSVASVLIVVEAPDLGLARRLADADDADPLPWLALWRESARALARFVRAARRRALVIDAADLVAQPGTVRDLVAQRLGADLSIAVRQPSAPSARPVVRSLAEALCADDADTQDLLVELRACCWPVGGDDAVRTGLDDGRLAVGATDVARDLGALLRCAARADELVAEMASLRGEVLARQQRLSTLQDELSQSVAQHQTAASRADQLERVLAETRAQAQAMLASAHGQGDARVAAVEAAARQQVAALEEMLDRQRGELAEAARALEVAQARADSQQAMLDRVLDELEQAQQALAAARKQAEREQDRAAGVAAEALDTERRRGESALAAAIETHTAELAAMREALGRCEAERDAARATLAVAQSAATGQQQAIEHLTALLHQLQAEQIARHEQARREHEQARREHEAAAQRLAAEQLRGEQALAAAGERHAVDVAALRDTLARCEAERDAARAALAAARDAAAGHQEAIDRLTGALHQVQAELAEHHERSQQEQADAAARLVAEQARGEQALSAVAERHAGEMAALRDTLARCEAERAAAQAKADDQQQAFDRLVSALHQVQEELERVHHQAVAERERAAATLQAEQARAKEALAARDEKVTYLRNQWEQARAELAKAQEVAAKTLEQARRDHDKALTTLRAQADKASAEGRAAREAATRLEQDLKNGRQAHARDCTARDEKMAWLREQLEKARAEAAGRAPLQAELERLAARQQALQAELAAARDERQVDATAARAAREEADELLVHLHEAQAQVEQLHERQRELSTQLEAARSAAVEPAVTASAVGRWTVVAERDTLPYRELTVRAERLTVGERSADDCPLRLVEHHGHPGLVLFAPVAQPHPLPSWRETGREGDAPYLRLMPDDPHCRPVFEAMGSTEWLAVLDIARSLRDDLAAAVPSGLDPAWIAIARRLGEALAEMPMRARVDAVDVVAEPGSGRRDALRLTLHRFTCGSRVLPRLDLAWQPRGRDAGLTLLADPATGPVLPIWPTDASGLVADRLTLPLGADVAAGVKRARWRALPPADRAMLIAVLDAMPGWLVSAPQAAGAAAAARALADDARACSAAPASIFRPRAALRRAVRLLGTPAPAAA